MIENPLSNKQSQLRLAKDSARNNRDRERPGTDHPSRCFPQARGESNFRAAAKTASNISSLKRPVNVFCWLGW